MTSWLLLAGSTAASWWSGSRPPGGRSEETQAWVHYKDTKPFAIYADETMIGFVSMYVGEENYQIINFLIDDAYQKKGYGTAAAKLCIDFLYKEYKARRVSAPVNQCHTAAQKFWTKLGFAYSDSVEDGYVFMRLNLV